MLSTYQSLKLLGFVSILVSEVLLLPSLGLGQDQNPPVKEMTVVELVDLVQPAIFRIETDDGTGSGFIIHTEPELTKDGKLVAYLVTNAHVVGPQPSGSPVSSIRISGGRPPYHVLNARVKGYDELTDLAVISTEFSPVKRPFPFGIRPEDYGITVLKWADARQMRVGEDVVVVGFPRASVVKELEPTVTAGILSAKNRSFGDGTFADLIQTDAAISGGNSGGPLLNRRGEVVGVNTYTLTTPLTIDVDLRKIKAILDDKDMQTALADPKGPPLIVTIAQEVKLTQGIFFARSCNTAAPFVASMIEYGEVRRAGLGCVLALVKGPDAEKTGLFGWVVRDIEKGSPADKAGIQEFDVLQELGGLPVLTLGQLMNALALVPRGKELELKFIRPSPQHVENLRAGKGLPPWEYLQDYRTTKITL